MPHGAHSAFGYALVTRDRGATWSLARGGGFRMNAAPAPPTLSSEETKTASGRRFRLREQKNDGDETVLEASSNGRVWRAIDLGLDRKRTLIDGPMFDGKAGCLLAKTSRSVSDRVTRVMCTNDGGASWRSIHEDDTAANATSPRPHSRGSCSPPVAACAAYARKRVAHEYQSLIFVNVRPASLASLWKRVIGSRRRCLSWTGKHVVVCVAEHTDGFEGSAEIQLQASKPGCPAETEPRTSRRSRMRRT